MTKGFNLCEPSAFEHNAIERRSLFTLRPARRLVASVWSGSNLKKYQYLCRISMIIFFSQLRIYL
jgi:hypothetical protein